MMRVSSPFFSFSVNSRPQPERNCTCLLAPGPPACRGADFYLLDAKFGRQSGSVESFSYTEANKKAAVHWDENTLFGTRSRGCSKLASSVTDLCLPHLCVTHLISMLLETLRLP
jgi:hypothetical protein